MTDQLPNVKLAPEQEARAVAMANEMSKAYWGPYSTARVIVHQQDRIAELERHLNKATIERAWAIGKLREAGQMYCCDINAAHPGKHRGGCPSETTGDGWDANGSPVRPEDC